MLREVKYIVVHCTQTPTEVDAEVIRDAMKENNRLPMFHGMVDRYGHFMRLIGCNSITDISFPFNEDCYHIAYVGGVRGGKNCDTRNPIQHHALFVKLRELHQLFPQAKIIGADYFTGSKENPGFDVQTWFSFFKAHGEYWVDYEENEQGEWIFVE